MAGRIAPSWDIYDVPDSSGDELGKLTGYQASLD